MTNSMLQESMAFIDIQKLRQQTHAGYIEVILSCGEDRYGGPLDKIMQFTNVLLRDKECLTNLEVSIKEQEDSASEILNILNHHLCEEIENSNLHKTKGLRYSFESRIQYIHGALDKWLQSR